MSISIPPNSSTDVDLPTFTLIPTHFSPLPGQNIIFLEGTPVGFLFGLKVTIDWEKGKIAFKNLSTQAVTYFAGGVFPSLIHPFGEFSCHILPEYSFFYKFPLEGKLVAYWSLYLNLDKERKIVKVEYLYEES